MQGIRAVKPHERPNQGSDLISDKDSKGIELTNNTTIYTLNKNTGEIKLFPSMMPESVRRYAITNSRIVSPVYNPYMLREYASVDSTHSACITLVSNTVGGIGYYFREKKASENQQIKDFCLYPSGDFENSFLSLIKSIHKSKITFGYGYWEFIKVDDIYRIYKVDSPVNVFVVPKKNKNGENLKQIDHFEQITKYGSVKKFFPFNVMKPKDIVDGRRYLIRFATNYERNSFYAIPNYYSAISKIKTNYFIETCNTDFFKNRMHPDLVFIFTGGHLQTGQKDEIKNYYQQNTAAFKGIGNQHKTMVLSQRGKNSKIEVKDLNTINSDFNLNLKKENDLGIARAWNVQPKLVAIAQGQGGLVGGSADIGQLFTQHQLNTKSEQVDFEMFINKFFLAVFGINPNIKLETVDLINPKDLAIIHDRYHKNGVITVLEQRKSVAYTGVGVTHPEDLPKDKPANTEDKKIKDDPAGGLDDKKDDQGTPKEDKFSK